MAVGTGVGSWSTTAGSNESIGSINWQEGVQMPSTVNNSARQMMADTRFSLNEIAGGWFQLGDGDGQATYTYVSGTSFRVDGVDVTSSFHVGRRIRLTAPTPGTIYGTITASSFSTNTTLTIVWDSGSLSSEAITLVYIGILPATNSAIPTLSSYTLTSTDAGAAEAPTLVLYRDSASPANADVLGAINFQGRDSGAGVEVYGKIRVDIVDVTAASENAKLVFQTDEAGTLATRFTIGGLGGGVYLGTATGTDKGAGTYNAATAPGYYLNGAAASRPLLATLTASASATLAFTLGDDALYAAYECVLTAVLPATDTALLNLRLDSDAGASFDSGSTYAWAIDTFTMAGAPSVSPTGDDVDTEITTTTAVDSVGGFICGTITVVPLTTWTKVHWQLNHLLSDGATHIGVIGWGVWGGPAAANAIQFLMSSGNITSGVIRVYGVPK